MMIKRRVRFTLSIVWAFILLILPACTATTVQIDENKSVDELFFFNELNRFLGSGGEILVNEMLSEDDPTTPGVDRDGTVADPDLDGPIPPHLIQRLDVGDRLIGIGIAHAVESLSRPPGRETFHALVSSGPKAALRAFVVVKKEVIESGFKFTFGPLSPQEFSDLVAEVSDGLVKIPVESIPEGTMVLSFDHDDSEYTLESIPGSPGRNWELATAGARHWNIGVAQGTDFWVANFDSDDLGLLSLLPSSAKVGSIRFGLSLLPGSKGYSKLEKVSCVGPDGNTTMHHFCLSGTAAGTNGFDTPFPIGLRTEIIFRPVR